MPTFRVCAVLFLCGHLVPDLARAQTGLNNLWCGGFENWAPVPFGGLDINYSMGSLQLAPIVRDIGFYRTSANISSSNGTLLFSTNGAFLGDVAGDTLMNGTGINPCTYTTNYPNGLFIPQAEVILQKPDTPSIFLMLHGSLDNEMNTTAQYLYLSVVDMSLNSGLGAVTIKNQVLINDGLNVGKIVAVRHANGRDWWVFCHKASTDQFYGLLVTPDGVIVVGTQSVGIVRPPDAGQVCFSPDGSKFAYYWGVDELEVFDFDRCSGLFSNPRFIVVPDDAAGPGVAFSPNSRFLYVSSVADVYQYDTDAADVGASVVHIATWDGFYSPQPPFATAFDIAQLAPDGKIYIGTGNGTQHLHVIHDPDQPGMACNIEQHGIALPRWFSNSLPNHPNYHLGPIDGSVCDSLGLNVGVAESLVQEAVQAYPNPTDGAFTLSYAAQPNAGVLEVRDLSGKLVLRERLPQWSTVHNLQLQAVPGMYHCTLRWGASSASTRIIVTKP